MRREGAVVRIIVTEMLEFDDFCYSIFYNIMFGGCGGWGKVSGGGFLDIDDEVETIEEGAREFFTICLDLVIGTSAFVGSIAEVATGAGVHGGDEHEISGVGGAVVGAGNGDTMILERLAEGFEDVARIFGEFVEKENAKVSEGDFARTGVGAATNDRTSAGGMMRGAKGVRGDDGVGEAGERVDFSDSDLLGGGRGGEEIGASASEEGFAGAGWTGDE